MSESTPHSINPEFQFWAKHEIADTIINGFREIDEDGAVVLEEGVGFRMFAEEGVDKGELVMQLGGTVKVGGKSEVLVSDAYQQERSNERDPQILISMQHNEIAARLKGNTLDFSHKVLVRITEGIFPFPAGQHELFPDNDGFLEAMSRDELNLVEYSKNRPSQLQILGTLGLSRVRWGLEQFSQHAYLNREQRDVLQKIVDSYKVGN